MVRVKVLPQITQINTDCWCGSGRSVLNKSVLSQIQYLIRPQRRGEAALDAEDG
jgi:hypothetical protein